MRSLRPEPDVSPGRSASVVALLVLAAVVVVGLVIVQPWADDEAAPPPATDEPDTSTTTTTEPIHEGHRPTLSSAAPLSPRVGAGVVWTGTELVVWGGIAEVGPYDQPVSARNDGAALDLASNTWRMLPESPFPDRPDQLPADIVKPELVVTEAGLVVVSDRDTALWDPDENSWLVMAPAPAPVGTLVSDGGHVYSAQANSRLDVTTGEWQSLPEPPSTQADVVSAWTGEELVVAGLRAKRQGPP